jgi:hypothetical protein
MSSNTTQLWVMLGVGGDKLKAVYHKKILKLASTRAGQPEFVNYKVYSLVTYFFYTASPNMIL